METHPAHISCSSSCIIWLMDWQGWKLTSCPFLCPPVCTQLLVSRPDEENITSYLQLIEKCLTHEVRPSVGFQEEKNGFLSLRTASQHSSIHPFSSPSTCQCWLQRLLLRVLSGAVPSLLLTPRFCFDICMGTPKTPSNNCLLLSTLPARGDCTVIIACVFPSAEL